MSLSRRIRGPIAFYLLALAAAIALAGLALVAPGSGGEGRPAAALVQGGPDRRSTAGSGSVSSSSHRRAAARGDVAAAAPRARFVAGDERVYAIAMAHEVAVERDAGTVETLTTALRGTWTLTVVEAGPRRTLARGVFRTDEVSAGAGGGDALAGGRRGAVAADLARPHHLELRADGRLEALHVTPDGEPLARGLLQALAAATQVVLAGDGEPEWRCEESDPTGDYLAGYARAHGRALEKRKLGYVRLASGAPADTASVVERVAIALDEGDWPARLVADGRLSLRAAAPMPAVAATARVEMRLVGRRRVEPAAPAALALEGQERIAVGAVPGRERIAREADRGLLAGADFQDLVLELAATPLDDDDAWAVLGGRFAALFRLDPGTARLASEAVRAGAPAGRGAAAIIGALGEAGSEPAQRALAEILEHAPLDPATREQAAVALALTERPTEAAIDALSRTIDAAPAGELRSAAALALGATAARTAAGGASERGHAIAGELEDRLDLSAANEDDRALFLRALGNAGRARSLAPIAAALAEPSPYVRSAAVEALRFIDDPLAEALVLDHLGSDPDPVVRRTAAFAAGFRPLARVLPALDAALAGDEAVAVRLEIVGFLSDRMAREPSARALVERAARLDPADEVREAARQSLAR